MRRNKPHASLATTLGKLQRSAVQRSFSKQPVVYGSDLETSIVLEDIIVPMDIVCQYRSEIRFSEYSILWNWSDVVLKLKLQIQSRISTCNRPQFQIYAATFSRWFSNLGGPANTSELLVMNLFQVPSTLNTKEWFLPHVRHWKNTFQQYAIPAKDVDQYWDRAFLIQGR